jgi:S-adenosylmethionine decarboxylase
MSYQPGTHLIATFSTNEKALLRDFTSFQLLVNEMVTQHNLHKLGEVYHNFQPEGYTGVVCLSESHLSVHTWPEHGKVNVDIYLSNYLRNNDGTVQEIYGKLKAHFKASVVQEQSLRR